MDSGIISGRFKEMSIYNRLYLLFVKATAKSRVVSWLKVVKDYISVNLPKFSVFSLQP
jgi:hypothetical protein